MEREYEEGGEEDGIMAGISMITESHAFFLAVITDQGDIKSVSSSSSLVDALALRHYAILDCKTSSDAIMSGTYHKREDFDAED